VIEEAGVALNAALVKAIVIPARTSLALAWSVAFPERVIVAVVVEVPVTTAVRPAGIQRTV
jgi:hypothetical protein